MSRSGYFDEGYGWEVIIWRGAVKSALRGKRGQAFLREMLAAMDAMRIKRLIANDLVKGEEVCAIGTVVVARGADISGVDPEDCVEIAKRTGIAEAMVREIAFVNDDEYGYGKETPEQRFSRVYRWIKEQIKDIKEKASP